jgi:hypothetical protein
MFFNLKKSWSNVRYAQRQQIEKHPVETSGTLKVKRLKNILGYHQVGSKSKD